MNEEKKREELTQIIDDISSLEEIPMTWEIFKKIMVLIKRAQQLLNSADVFQAWLQFKVRYSPGLYEIFIMMEKYQDQCVMAGLTTAQAFLTCRRMYQKKINVQIPGSSQKDPFAS